MLSAPMETILLQRWRGPQGLAATLRDADDSHTVKTQCCTFDHWIQELIVLFVLARSRDALQSGVRKKRIIDPLTLDIVLEFQWHLFNIFHISKSSSDRA